MSEPNERETVSVYICHFKGARLRLTVYHDVIFEDFLTIKDKFLNMYGEAFEFAVNNTNYHGPIAFQTELSTIQNVREAFEDITGGKYAALIKVVKERIIEFMEELLMEDEALVRGETSHNIAQTIIDDDAIDAQRRWLDANMIGVASDATAANEDGSPILSSRLFTVPRRDETIIGNFMTRPTKKKPTLFKRIKNLVFPSRTKIDPLESIDVIRLGGMKRTQKKRYKKSQKKRYKRRPKRRATKRT
jgi:hypothetical protein